MARALPGDRKVQGDAGLRVLDPERQPLHVDALPAQGQHLLTAHAGVEPEPQGIADRRNVDLRLDPGAPAGKRLRRGRDLAPRLAVELTAAGYPEIDRIAQPVSIDTGPAIDRAQQRDGPVGRRPPMVRGDSCIGPNRIYERGTLDAPGIAMDTGGPGSRSLKSMSSEKRCMRWRPFDRLVPPEKTGASSWDSRSAILAMIWVACQSFSAKEESTARSVATASRSS